MYHCMLLLLLNHQYRQYIKPLLSTILTILFTRLQKKQTGKFVRCLILFFSLFAYKHGGQALLESIEALQPGYAFFETNL